MTTPNGTSAVNAPSDQYTYNAPPTVTAVSPNNGPAAGTNTVTVSGTGFTGATAVDFGARTRAPRSTCSARTSLTVTAPSGTGTVDVTVTTPNGTSAVNAPSDHYTYNAPPTVTAVSPEQRASGRDQHGHGDRHRVRLGLDHVDFGSNAGTSVDVTSPPRSPSSSRRGPARSR